jgi:sugar phosphate isomerase/epimerase
MVRSVNLCAQYAAMVHIKDGEKKDGNVQYCLPGDGSMDITGFFAALRANGLDDMPVFAEVSVQKSSSPDYDPKDAAGFCFRALDRARKELD